MTHFASAADYTITQTEDQIAVFENVLGKLQQAGVLPNYVHLSSSNAIAHGRRPRFENAVRPGLAIYGYVTPAHGQAQLPLLRVMPALSWKAAILAVKEVPEGALIGYDAMFRTTRPSRIAILGVGYADGYPRQLSNRGQVIAGGQFAPIVGAMSMDVTTIDVSQSPQLQPGDAVTLLGRERDLVLDAMQIACTAGTISYNVLCTINPRVKRVYTD
jgi:alanine racemase